MEPDSFANNGDEISYWHRMAEDYRRGMEEAREELDEFQANSRELEFELETQLKQLEGQNRELLLHTEKLTTERDLYRERLETNQSHVNAELTRAQEELAKYKMEIEKQQRYIRELEQVNDDLERSKRAAVVSLEDFEAQLNKAIERNAILENELDEKEDLIVTVQRLKEETRDLHQELALTRRQPLNHEHQLTSGVSLDIPATSDKIFREITVQTDPPSTGPLLTPSVRIAALNMVNDALQKIGHLEYQLSELYRCYGAPPLSAPSKMSTNVNSSTGLMNVGMSKTSSIDKSYAYGRRGSSRNWTNGSVHPDTISLTTDGHDGCLRVGS